MGKENTGIDRESGVATKERQKVEEPPLFKVLLHNDDYTTMDFVVMVLKAVFNKDAPAATEIMLNVHKKGMGVCGIYTHEIAETKVYIVNQMAIHNNFPLKCSMEEL